MIPTRDMPHIMADLPYPENYYIYADFTNDNTNVISISINLITIENWKKHYDAILNIMRDGIYRDRVQALKVNVNFGDIDVDLSIMDYFFNLIMWNMLIKTDIRVRPCHIFFPENLKAGEIKDYIDDFFITVNRSKFDNKTLNNIIADVLQCFHDIDIFSDYLANTVNLEDTAELMGKNPAFYDCLHQSFAHLPFDEVKGSIDKVSKKSIEYIKQAKALLGHDHCLADDFRTGEGLNPKQYAETTIGIGPKPNGKGGLFPSIIDHAFINGGVSDPIEYFIESSTGRIAQIVKFNNVSTSGTFARILSLNNMDSRLYDDENYDCHTNHLIPVIVRNDAILKSLNLLYYREKQNGIEKCINWKKDKHLIGKTIFVRTPITCVSNANGHGVCYKCYGKLAYTVFDRKQKVGINIGRIAVEVVTAKLTQMQLSVKHILEAIIDKITWCEAFGNFFEIEGNIIQLTTEINYKDFKMLIDPDSIESDFEDLADNEEDDEMAAAMNYAEYITSFDILQISTGQVFHIDNDKDEKLYITTELNKSIRRKAEPVDGFISIPLNDIKEIPLFTMILQNNEITKTLKMISALYNKADHVRGKTISQHFQDILDTNVEGKLGINAVHYAVMLMNQVKNPEALFETPNWRYANPQYTILSLNESINNNPSITISLSYQKIGKLFYAPLTYKKRGVSFMDLFFMLTPQRVIRDLDNDPVMEYTSGDGTIRPIIFAQDSSDDITTRAPIDVEDDVE